MSLRQEVYQYFTHRTMAVVVVSGAFVASTALVVGGWKTTHGPEVAVAAPRTLEVTGTATRHLVPNKVTWTITLHGHGDDKDTAIQAAHDAAEAAHTWLNDHGVKDSELSFAQASAAADESTVTRHNADGTEYQEDLSTGLDSSLVVTVESTDIARILTASRMAGIANELQGAEADDPSCTAPDSDKLEQPLLAEARKGAHAKAETALSDYGNAKLGKLLVANVGSFEVTSSCSDVTATASTSVTYEIE